MKKAVSLFLALVIILCTLVPCSGADLPKTYFINSLIGNDTNSGTSEASPWWSVTNLIDLELKPGDKVLFARGGDYECDCLTITCEGTEEKPIVISSYGDENLPKAHIYTEWEGIEVFRLFDCSYVTMSDLEITAPNGGGIWIDTREKTSVGITLTGLTMHDMQNEKQESRDTLCYGAAVARACVMVKGLPANSRYAVNDLTITDCEMYDVGNGISLWGSWNDEQNVNTQNVDEVDPIFNENTLVKDVYFHDMTAEAIIVGICKNALVTNCRAINCCQDEGTDEKGNVKFYAAAMFFWGSVYSTFDHCEIAGMKNVGDGMAVDFDSYSHHCTYQYIYSHDNMTFMKNNANLDGQHGNSVHHCLSVNDNGGDIIKFSKVAGEYEFSFYNNTIVNCGDVEIKSLYNSIICNNIFIPKAGATITYEVADVFNTRNNTIKNNCYYNCLKPLSEVSSKNTAPGFVSDDYSEADSFKLSSGSKLIGSGYQNVPSEEKDFYGNEITSNNIGCYGGNGEGKTPPETTSIFTRLKNFISSLKNIFLSK